MCAVRLTWDDNNSGASEEDGFKVYRSSAPIDLAALPAPITTLPSGSTAYDDLMPLSGDNYYVVSTYRAGSVRYLEFDVITIGGGGPVTSVFTDYTTLAGITPVAGWATVLRNAAYIGPAIQITDFTNSANTTDVFFNGNGALSGAVPYGLNARVTKIYDQFGTEDLTIALAKAPEIAGDDAAYKSWRIVFKKLGGMLTPSTTTDNPAWEIANPLWTFGGIRREDAGLQCFWYVASSSGYMKMGLWQEGRDLHGRVNGSSPLDWSSTDWVNNATDVQNVLGRCVTDCFESPAKGYFNGVLSWQLGYTSPITFSDGKHLVLGGNEGEGIVGVHALYDFTELVIFDQSAALSSTNKDALDAALNELNV